MTKISTENIAKAIYIESKNKQGEDLNLFVKNVVRFFHRKKIFFRTKDILGKLEEMLHTENKALKVKIHSTEKLDEDTRRDLTLILKKRYTVEEILWTEVVDAKLIGGFKLEIKDEIIDLTMLYKLKELQAHLIR